MSRRSLVAFCKRRELKAAALVLLSVLFLVLLIQTFNRAYRDTGYDLTSYLASAQAVLNGDNPYETGSPFNYSYPMFFAFLLIPLSVLPQWLSNFIWYLINLVSLFASFAVFVKLSSRGLKTDWGAHLYAPITAILLIMTPVIQNNLLNGQANFVVLLFCALFLQSHFEGRVFRASFFLALAVAIKLVPLALFLFLLVRRSYRTLALSALLAIGFCLLPVVTLGDNLFDYYGDYIRGFIFGNFTGNPPDQEIYFTLHGFLAQIWPVLSSFPGSKIASALVVALAVAVVDLLSLRRNRDLAGLWTCHFYLIAILLISPMSEIHHLAFLLPAFLLLPVKVLYDYELPARTSGILLTGFVTFFYIARVYHGPFFFIGILLLFVAVAQVSMRTTVIASALRARSGSETEE